MNKENAAAQTAKQRVGAYKFILLELGVGRDRLKAASGVPEGKGTQGRFEGPFEATNDIVHRSRQLLSGARSSPENARNEDSCVAAESSGDRAICDTGWRSRVTFRSRRGRSLRHERADDFA